MSDQHGHDEHDLRARLAAADPAASLPLADPERVARLLEDTMATDPTPVAERRSPLTWLVAAAAAVVIVTGVGLVLTNGGGEQPVADPGPQASPSAPATSATAPQGVTALEAGSPDEARCMPPTPELLAGQDVVLAGTVEAVTADAVRLRVEEAFAGEPGASVELRAPQEALESLIGAVGFEPGGRYLVAAVEGQVSWCGFSGEDTPRLRALYDRAFPR